MRELYNRSHKMSSYNYLRRSRKMYDGEGKSWYRHTTYMTKNGTVVINEDCNVFPGHTYYNTDFTVVINGRMYCKGLDTVDIPDASLKLMATKFLKECIEKSKQ